MNNNEAVEEPRPPEYERLGARALTSTLISREVPPECHPLGPHNKVVIAPGLLAGSAAPCSNKLSVGGKSPLTGGIKESNVGGRMAYRMARLRIAAIIIEGQSDHFHPHVINVGAKRTVVERADDLVGLGNYELHKKLQERHGPNAAILSIGPAGELRLGAACLMANDMDDHPSRAAARGGLGAVMGAKGVKAIVIPHSTAEKPLQITDAEKFKTLAHEFGEKLRKYGEPLTKWGTAVMVDAANAMQGLPTRNYHSGSFEGAEKINAATLVKTIEERDGVFSSACTPGCPIRCSNVYNDPDKKYLTSSLEYETICMMGSNLGIDNLDMIARLDRACDDAGLDTIETGATLGVAMETGLINFGDGEAALKLIHEVSKGTIMGRAIGSGVTVFSRIMGIDRIPAVKGQSLPAYDPRTFKGMGVTFASSPMGADHTAGPAIPGRKGLDTSKEIAVTQPEGQVELSRDLQVLMAIVDQLGFCMFVGPEARNLPVFADFLKARYGWELSEKDLLEMGRSVLRLERDFNRKAGICEPDSLPDWLRTEPSPPSGRVFDVDINQIRKMEF